MRLPFYKYQATGNDFVIINQLVVPYLKNPSSDVIQNICDRRFGIGADGLMLLEKDEETDFKMTYYNSDGGLSTMCGNGGRCIVHLAKQLKLFKTECSFQAPDGIHEASIDTNGLVRLEMSDVQSIKDDSLGYVLDTGSPHLVIFKDAWDRDSIVEEARSLRYREEFAPGGINVNYIHPDKDGSLMVRTYERGVEDETYSCGTGVTAAALVAKAFHPNYQDSLEVPVITKGGNLKVQFQGNVQLGFSKIYLIGPAKRVFEGSIEIGESDS